MEKTYLVKMVPGDSNEWYNTTGSTLPAPKTIFETSSLQEARQVQEKTKVVFLDEEVNRDGEQIFLAPVVIEVVDGVETMLD